MDTSQAIIEPVQFTFTEEFCRTFFDLSCDRNTDLHGSEGLRIVQAAAIFTAMATAVSIRFPELMAREVNLKFKRPVHIGDQIEFHFSDYVTVRHGKLYSITVMTLLNGQPVMSPSVVTLVPKK